MKENGPRRPWRVHARNFVQRLFPERQVVLRAEGRVTYVRLTPRIQVYFFAVVFLALGWTTFSSVNFLRHNAIVSDKDRRIAEIVAEKDRRISQSREAYQVLLDQFRKGKRVNETLTDNLEGHTSVIRDLTLENKALQQQLEIASAKINQTELERQKILAAREDLKSRLNGVQQTELAVKDENRSLQSELETRFTELEGMVAERDQVMFEANRMRRHITELESRLASLQDQQVETVQRLNDQANALIDDASRVIELTGLSVSEVLGQETSMFADQGGPFVATQPDGLPADKLKANLNDLDLRVDQWSRLQDVIRRLPLAPPLNYYYVTAKYGKRRDPINKKWAMHYGLDLGSTFKRASILASAPGVVTYAGWRGNYGKLVEIDHGAGIKTRYGHMHSITVKKGQKIKFQEKIGLLGNTGRSTGAHLHYEVVVKDKPKNPSDFIKAGRYVFQE